MAVLRADRVVEFHSQVGKHHSLRIPKVSLCFLRFDSLVFFFVETTTFVNA